MKVYILVYLDTNCDCMERLVPCGIYSTKEKAQEQIDTTRQLFPSYVSLKIVETDMDRGVARYHNYTQEIDGWYPDYITELGNMHMKD